MDVSSIALQGLEQSDAQLNTAAEQIAGTSASPSGVDVVSLSQDIVAMISAQASYSANLAVLNTADQIEQSLIDVTA